jgi:hypothetical protein
MTQSVNSKGRLYIYINIQYRYRNELAQDYSVRWARCLMEPPKYRPNPSPTSPERASHTESLPGERNSVEQRLANAVIMLVAQSCPARPNLPHATFNR